MKFRVALLMLALSMTDSFAMACGGFGNPNTGCANSINGIEIWDDGTLEIDVKDQKNWHPDAVCKGAWSLQFRGKGLGLKTSIALTAFKSNYPIFFRCNKKINDRDCECQFIVIGDHWRD